MAFRLDPEKSLSREIRRIVLRQLDAATAGLTAVGDPASDAAVHDARRRVKKIRALIRLVRPSLDKRYRAVDKDLREVGRLLAPVADGQGIIATLNTLARRYRARLPKPVVASIRAGLVERGSHADRRASRDRVLQISAATLRSERRRVKNWALRAEGFRAIGPGLEASFRRARKTMRATHACPTVDRFHEWRCLVKRHWYQVRLLEGCCGDQLLGDQRRLEALDGILGEYHNLALLRDVLVHHQYVSPAETTRCLWVVSGYQLALRQQAHALGEGIYKEKPRAFVRRIKQLWRGQAPDRTHAPTRPDYVARRATAP